MNSHEVDYKIYGDDLQAVEVELDPNETVGWMMESILRLAWGTDLSLTVDSLEGF